MRKRITTQTAGFHFEGSGFHMKSISTFVVTGFVFCFRNLQMAICMGAVTTVSCSETKGKFPRKDFNLKLLPIALSFKPHNSWSVLFESKGCPRWSEVAFRNSEASKHLVAFECDLVNVLIIIMRLIWSYLRLEMWWDFDHSHWQRFLAVVGKLTNLFQCVLILKILIKKIFVIISKKVTR